VAAGSSAASRWSSSRSCPRCASSASSRPARRLVALDKVETIAGTLAPRNVGPHTLALASQFVDEVVLVSDDELKGAMKTLWSELRVLVEPAGAAAVAAVAGAHVEVRDRRVAVLVCGANLDVALAAEALG
jgi:threonine dehydratase